VKLYKTAINGLRSTKDYVKFCDPAGMRHKKICINKNLLSSARKAYSLYNARIEEEKREKLEKRKKKREQAVFGRETGTGIFGQETESKRLLNSKKMATLEEKERNLQEAVMQKICHHSMLCEGTSKLADALKNNDIRPYKCQSNSDHDRYCCQKF